MPALSIESDRIIFGGSFDPPHRGHLLILRFILTHNQTLAIDLVPAAVSPFKTDTPPTDGPSRRRLLKAALEDLAEGADLPDSETKQHGIAPIDIRRITLRTLELDRPPPSYTADTCAVLRDTYPGQKLGLLIGSDSLRDFDRWTRVAEILAHHTVYVFRRQQESIATIQQLIEDLTGRFDVGATFVSLPNPLFPCSSTDVRRSIPMDGLDDCLTPRVARLITDLKLYI